MVGFCQKFAEQQYLLELLNYFTEYVLARDYTILT